ncbi:MAG: hypothetical protein K2M06_02695 [Muribaculaceae bacterium]|nr:hypothetical protein [Muribaculaceae bacterium]
MALSCRHIFAVLASAAAVAAGLAGCSTSGCLDNRSAIPLAEFYSSEDGTAISLTGIAIYGVGAPGDSAVLLTPPLASRVYLPMRSTRSETSWAIVYRLESLSDPGLNDTVSFSYDSEPYFASSECGAMYRYRIRSVRSTTHVLDSVGILDSLITNVDIPTIRFYFRTAAMEEAAQ